LTIEQTNPLPFSNIANCQWVSCSQNVPINPFDGEIAMIRQPDDNIVAIWAVMLLTFSVWVCILVRISKKLKTQNSKLNFFSFSTPYGDAETHLKCH